MDTKEFLAVLPDDCLRHVFSYLNRVDLGDIALVNQRMRVFAHRSFPSAPRPKARELVIYKFKNEANANGLAAHLKGPTEGDFNYTITAEPHPQELWQIVVKRFRYRGIRMGKGRRSVHNVYREKEGFWRRIVELFFSEIADCLLESYIIPTLKLKTDFTEIIGIFCAHKFQRRVNNLEIQGRIEMDSITFPQIIKRIAPVSLKISENEVDIFLIQLMVNGRDRWDFNLDVNEGGQNDYGFASPAALQALSRFENITYRNLNVHPLNLCEVVSLRLTVPHTGVWRISSELISLHEINNYNGNNGNVMVSNFIDDVPNVPTKFLIVPRGGSRQEVSPTAVCLIHESTTETCNLDIYFYTNIVEAMNIHYHSQENQIV